MKELRVTTPPLESSGRGSNHYHIVYINTDDGYGAVSPGADGHTHNLIYDPPRPPVEPTEAIPPQIDPMTGMPVMVQDPETGEMMPDPGTPATPGDPGNPVGRWIVSPGGEDLHEHEVVEYKIKTSENKQLDKEIIDECMALWKEALEITRESREKGTEAEEFYRGNQWKDEVERALNKLDRAALTINEIAPNIDTLIGYQMEQRTDLRYLPQEGGDQRVADMLNVISKRILDSCYFHREETKVFKDICVPGMGVYNIFMDFSKTIQGEPVIERFYWARRHYGPHEKEDLSDCEYEVAHVPHSIANLKRMFPKKADEIEKSYKAYAGQYPDIKDNGINGTNTDYRSASKVDDPSQPYTVDGTLPLVDVQKKQFQLAQCTRKVYKEVSVVFNQEENFFFTAYDWDPKDVEQAAKIPGFQVISQIKTRMRITKFCGSVVLSDENPADLPVHDFFSVPVFAYRQNGEFWGKVEAAKDPQRELNKRRSQVMDTMNRLGASVYYTEPDTFKDNNERERFKKNRSKPGSMFVVNNIDRTPKLESGADVPAPLVQIMQMDQQNLQRLMNVVVEQAGANESGTMFLEKKKNRLTGNQFLLDNMAFAKQKIGRLLLPLIQRYYPAERLVRMLNAQYSKQKFEIGGKDYKDYSVQEITELIESTDLLEYDVIVTESSFSASTRLGIAKVLFELISQGAAIPPELALEFVDMPEDVRVRANESIQAQSESSAQAAADSSNSELAKSVVATGLYTIAPEKAQELGLVPVDQNPLLANGGSDPNNTEETNNAQTDKYAIDLASSLAG